MECSSSGRQEVVGIEARINGRVYRSLLDERGTRKLRSIRRTTIVSAAAVAIAFVLLTAYVTTWFPHADGSLEVAALGECIGLCLLMVFFGFWSIVQNLRIRPFILTPQGFTLPRVPAWDALAGRDTLIPIGRLMRVLVDKPRFRGSPYPRLRLEYVDEGGRQRTANIDGSDIEDPLEVMMHLKRLVPDKLDDTVAPFVHEDIERREHLGNPQPISRQRSEGSMFGLLFFFMVPFMALLMIFPFTGSAMVVTASVYTVIIIVIFLLGYRFVRIVIKSMTLHSSLATTTGITMPRTRFTSIFVKPRPEVPFKEIKQVRDGLDAVGWKDKACVETWHGETFHVSRQVVRQMSQSPLFDFDGYTMTSRGRPAHGGSPMFSPNYVLLVPCIVGLLLIPWLGAGLFSFMGFRVFLILMPLMLLLPFGMVAAGAVFAYRRYRSSDMTATPEMLYLPKARKRFREVPRSEVIEVTAVQGALEPYLLVLTGRGKLRVTIDVADDLLRNGYPIVDTYGFVGGSILYLLESPRGPNRADERHDGAEERGRQLAVEPDSAVRRRKNEHLRGSLLFLFMSLLVPAMFYFMTAAEGESMDLGDWAFVLLFSSLFIIPTAVFLIVPLWIKPQRIYERGVEVQGFWGKMRFTPWEKFTSAEEEDYKGVRKLVLSGKGAYTSVFGPVENYDLILDIVTRTLGEKAVKTLGKGEGPAGGTTTGREKAATSGARKAPPRMARAEVPSRYGNRMVGMGLTMGTMVTVTVVAMLLLTMAIPEPSPQVEPPQLVVGDASLLDMNGTHVSEDLRFERGVVVRDGEVLSIVDSLLIIAPFANGASAIYVEPGGRLELVNTTIVPVLDGRGFCIEIEGSALIDGCNLSYEPVLRRFQTGLRTIRVRSDDVIIQNSSFWGDLEVGVAVIGCSSIVRGCTFGNVSIAGVAVFDGALTVVDSTFVRCNVGILEHSGNLTVGGCILDGNRVGIQVWNASASVAGTLFRGNTQAIQHSSGHRPEVMNATFVNNFDDYDVLGNLEVVMMMLVLMLMLPALVIQAVVMAVWKATRWWEPDMTRIPTQATAH